MGSRVWSLVRVRRHLPLFARGLNHMKTRLLRRIVNDWLPLLGGFVGPVVVALVLNAFFACADLFQTQSSRLILPSRQSYTKTVNRVAKVSVILAMAVPHAMFLGGCLAVKVFFPRLVTWLANDTYATSMLSIWYPLIWTIAWIHNYHSFQKEQHEFSKSSFSSVLRSPTVASIKARLFRSPAPATAATNTRSLVSPTAKSSTARSSTASASAQPSYLRQTAAQRSRVQQTTNKRTPTKTTPTTPTSSTNGTLTGLYPRTTPSSSKLSEPATPAQEQPPQPRPPSDDTEYWLRYWVIYACLQAFARVAYLIPIVGSFVTKHPMVLSIAVELKLAFFIWLFGMERMLAPVVDAQQQDSVLAQALPQNLLHKHVTTVLVEFHAIVSEAVSKDRWNSIVVSKSKSVLNVFVMVKFLSEARKDFWLHILEESRPLVLPSITLLMPGFITQFGVVYVQYLLPSANSLLFQRQQEKNKENKAKIEGGTGVDDPRLLYLKYWVLHCMWAGLLSYFASILWWIPFSAHITYLTWCHLSFPRTIQDAYRMLESELIGFGLLQPRQDLDDAVLDFQATKTVQWISALSARLPSAASSELDDNDGGKDEGDAPSVNKLTLSTTNEEQSTTETPSTARVDLVTPFNGEAEGLDVPAQASNDEAVSTQTSCDMVGGLASTALSSETEPADENVDTKNFGTANQKSSSQLTSKRRTSPTSSLLKQSNSGEDSDYSGSSSHTSSCSDMDTTATNDENAGSGTKSSASSGLVRRSIRTRRTPVERTNL
jgi:hypothetical protein